jgi:hypothetical protein
MSLNPERALQFAARVRDKSRGYKLCWWILASTRIKNDAPVLKERLQLRDDESFSQLR